MFQLRRQRTNAVKSPEENYLGEINKTALLTAEQERTLAYQIAEGSTEARDQMVRANLRLVVNIARGYTGKGLALPDLISEGNLGLMRAVEGFDPSMNTRFSTYASYWIKQSIKRALVNTAKTIRIPAYMVKLLADWRRATNKLTDELGRPPTDEETAKYLGLSKKKLAIIKKAIRVYNTIPQADQGGEGDKLDGVGGDEVSPDQDMLASEDLSQVMRLLGRMEARKSTILRMRFGLDGNEPKTLNEIGEFLDLTRERVRQLEREALGELFEELSRD